MNFIDICSGIGGFRSSLENNGHNCLAFAEIDKYAKQSYRAIYDTNGEEELDDITAITDEHFRLYRGRCDIITGGFPCQAFSIAGNRRGFDDTRGTIFFHIARAIKEIQPSYVLLENVKGLFSHDKGRTFGTIIQALDELGYVTEWGLFNSKYWGVPQNRERVYILVTRKDVYDQPKLFDLLKQQTEVTTRLVDVLEDEVDEKYYLSEEKTKKLTLDNDLGGKLNIYDYNERDKVHSVNKVSPTLNTMQGGDRQPKVEVLGNVNPSGNGMNGNIYETDGLSPTLTTNKGEGSKIAIPVLTPDRVNKRQNGRRFKEDGEPMFTLTSQDKHGIAIREATKQGYAVAEQGDSVNVSYPTSKTRRGRVGKQVAQTLQAGEVNQGVVINSKICRRCNSKLKPSDLEDYEYVCFECDENFYEFETKDEPKAIIGSTQKNAYVGNGSTSPSLTSAMGQGGGHVPMPVYSNLRIRKLTPLECWRLQGFTDEQFYKAKDSGVSNSQLYKQAGNSVTVNVVDAIVKCL
ncbi:DNA (cytosine-5-)-methyltransferase [Staphylococcus pseudoxylosus]|uniref:DNA (cytosine-5-)-methyltransferase n=1 Tax=Staphylococcus pseudoxylosus TaxID=2282419 RepID=UPI002DBD7415|nr:DNA (cytosine-5-)-methyltransferase [Staphylococcus pseudoxylosus]MEB6046015.1 DNA (cytosine-5-)-methyltransferase [Staphylococcus pseudoxylosus]